MMSERERTDFRNEMGAAAWATLQRGEDVSTVLKIKFTEASKRHPDDEDRLLELWDELVSRPII